ncbi:hypothetical protein BU098_14285, partial [Staphylococcus xylosus]
ALLMLLVIPPVTLSQDNQVSSTASATQEEVYPISNSDQPPHNIVGKLHFSTGFSATGFVIGQDTILTNRHVANNLNQGTEDFKLALNRHNKGQKILGSYDVVSAIYPSNAEEDVAILKVKPKQDNLPLNKVVAPANIGNANYIDDQWLTTSNNKFHIAGYPGNREKEVMWGSNGKLTGLLGDSKRFYSSDIAAATGSSGSPLFDENNQVVGILNSGHDNESNETFGFLFKDDLFDFIINNR